jgi:hypothetical protein
MSACSTAFRHRYIQQSRIIIPIFVTFKRHATPDFFSLVFSTLGGFLYAVAVSLLVLELANPYQNIPGQGGFVLHGHWK